MLRIGSYISILLDDFFLVGIVYLVFGDENITFVSLLVLMGIFYDLFLVLTI